MLTLRIGDMTCGHCASTIARAVAEVDKAARIDVDIRQKLVRIESTAPGSEMVEAIQEAGYTPEPLAQAPAPAVRASGGCGCGARAALLVDLAQAAPPQGQSCCG